jgi:8-amino-7-oxononanoate synthase
VVTPHNDVRAVRQALAARRDGRAWVVVESYYSMDADGPDLGELRRSCDEYGAALVVDEAHALGVLGPGGRGRSAETGIRPDVLVGTLGKAFGGQGAFVAGAAILRDWLYNRARAFVFSTGLSPALARAALDALEAVARDHEARDRVLRNAAALRQGLADLTPPGVVRGFGHVVPVIFRDPGSAVRASVLLAEHGVHVPAIRPPTVPPGTARLRLTTTAAHQPADIDRALTALAKTFRELDAR